MSKRFLAASLLAVALVLSGGVHQLQAECAMVCHVVVTPHGSYEDCSFSC